MVRLASRFLASALAPLPRDRGVSAWLLLLALMVLGMVLGGGYLRESNTGFAILEWQPLTGAVPPLHPEGWRHFYDLYAPTAQSRLYHPGLTAEGYAALFWPEWRDRNWGRLIGLVFLLPGLWFWWRGRITPALGLRLLGILAIGLFQAWYGWYLTQSGLGPAGPASPPPAMVAVHLLTAVAIYAALLWTGLRLRRPATEARRTPHPRLRLALILTAIAVPATMGMGALVAANHIAPPGVMTTPLVDAHIGLASLAALLALGTAVAGLRTSLPAALRDRFLLLAGFVALQYVLGLSALVSRSHAIGLAHELDAFLLLGASLWALHGLREMRAAQPAAAILERVAI